MVKIITVCVIQVFFFIPLFAQELTQYESVDFTTLGIPKVLMDRWGAVSTDIDNNGWPDIFAVKWRGRMSSQIYLNDGGMFTDIMDNSPDLIQVEQSQNATRANFFVDYDNDGDKDLFFGGDYDMFLFRNDNNVFTNVSQETGVMGQGKPGPFVSVYGFDCGAWADYDLDGDLDLVVCQTNNPDFFFFRNDDGVFVNIAEEVGLAGKNPSGNAGDRGAYSARLQWIDYDLDGDPDLSAGWLLFQNDDGYFTEVASSIGLTPDTLTFFQAWFDFDNDGDWDYFKIMHGRDDPGNNEFWENQDGQFVDITADVGLEGWRPHLGSSFNIGDYDNDGDEDVYIEINNWEDMDVFLLNEEVGPGDHVLADVASFVGLTVIGDRKGATMLDYDMDGFLDLFVPSLEFGSIVYHNAGNANNWIGLILEGTQSNRDAIGTLITVVTGEKRQMRYTRVPYTWKIQDNPYVHFGIGEATTIDSVIIRWPLGTVQVLTNPELNQYHTIQEPSGSAVDLVKGQMPIDWRLLQNYPNPFNAQTAIEFSIAKTAKIRIAMYDLQGRRVATLLDATTSPGRHRVQWDGKDQSGNEVASGSYLYSLESEGFRMTKKLVLLK